MKKTLLTLTAVIALTAFANASYAIVDDVMVPEVTVVQTHITDEAPVADEHVVVPTEKPVKAPVTKQDIIKAENQPALSEHTMKDWWVTTKTKVQHNSFVQHPILWIEGLFHTNKTKCDSKKDKKCQTVTHKAK